MCNRLLPRTSFPRFYKEKFLATEQSVIYTWNRFLQPIWSKFWNKNRKEEIETGVKGDTNKKSLVPEEDCCDNEIDTNVKNDSNRKKIN